MKASQQLTAAQVSETVQRSGLSRQEFAEQAGCGTSQLFKYQKEGLPPRMNRLVCANILQCAMRLRVLDPNAALRADIDKLAKGRVVKGRAGRATHRDGTAQDD